MVNKSRKVTRKRKKKDNYRKRYKLMRQATMVKIAAFVLVLFTGMVVSLIIPLRPTVSDSERRELTKFPTFTIESFLDGTYFGAIDTWFSDTFPFREQLLSVNDKVTSMHGFRDTVVHGEIVKGDDIPEVDVDIDELIKPVEKETESSGTKGDNIASTEWGSDVFSTEAESSSVTVEGLEGLDGSQVGEKHESIFVYGDSAYEYFVFLQNYSDEYVNIVNSLANSVADRASFYSVIIPTSTDITLRDDVRSSITSSDQRKAILYMYSRMGSNVNKTFVFDMLRSRRDEYLYFRSDHHWTALGAYYTYCMLAEQMGLTPNSLDKYTKKEFTNFQGTFYTQTGAASLISKPDTIYAYEPIATNKIQYIDRKGENVNYSIIANVSDFQPRNKYSTFIGGDNPYSEIKNPNLSDGSSCVVIKESFGNALVPFLVDHFEYVYVIDYRYYKGTVSDLVREKNIQNVIMLNNIAATSTSYRISEMQKVCK